MCSFQVLRGVQRKDPANWDLDLFKWRKPYWRPQFSGGYGLQRNQFKYFCSIASREWLMKWLSLQRQKKTSCSLWLPYPWRTGRDYPLQRRNWYRSVLSMEKLVILRRNIFVILQYVNHSRDFLTNIDPVFGACFTFNHNRSVNLTSIRAGKFYENLDCVWLRTYVWSSNVSVCQCFWLHADYRSHWSAHDYSWQRRVPLPWHIRLLGSYWLRFFLWIAIGFVFSPIETVLF